MLSDIGAKYVILGHSERRANHFEQNDDIVMQLDLAVDNGLIPIICIGEKLDSREDGSYLQKLEEMLSPFKDSQWIHSSLPKYIAYEPVWAIGTGKSADVTTAGEILSFIKSYFPVLWYLYCTGERQFG